MQLLLFDDCSRRPLRASGCSEGDENAFLPDPKTAGKMIHFTTIFLVRRRSERLLLGLCFLEVGDGGVDAN